MHWSGNMAAGEPEGFSAEVIPAEPPPPRSISSTINPRDLTPDMRRSIDELWSGTHDDEGISPRMTIKNHSTTIWGGLDLVIPSRRVRRKEDTDFAARADYEIGHVVGEGGVGTVFAARQASINRTVAIKMLREGIDADLANREKFLAEAVVTGELEHPNIVPIYDVGSNSKGQLFYSMKLVHGTPWSEALPKTNLVENLSILMRVCDAVAFAHAKGVVHRDLKPENVMLGGYGEVLVMDWGIAISTELLKKDANIKKSVSMGGTPAYMAPEMATGPLEAIDFRSDVYLLGAILFEIITDYPPHTGQTVTACLHHAARNEIVATDRSGELLEIAYKALSTHRASRYQSVAEFQDAIRQYQSHSESIALASRASQELAEARETGDYQLFARTLFAFQEAIALWQENETAHQGLAKARSAYAETALKKGDYDLGLSLLNPKNSTTSALYKSLLNGQRERATRQQRLRNVRRMVGGLLVTIFVVVSGFLFVVLQQKQTLQFQKNQLTQKRDELDSERRNLKESQRRLIEEKGKLVASEETLQDEKAKLVESEGKLRNKNLELQEERNLAQRLTVEAQQSKAVAQYRSYLAQIGLAAAKIEENAFDDAARILDAYAESPLKHWEWGRLRHFQQLDLQTIEGGIPVDSVAYSADGRRLAIGRRDGSVRIHTLKLENSSGMPTIANPDESEVAIHTGGQYVFDLAFSPDGRYLATASDRAGAYLALWDSRSGQRLPTAFENTPHTDWCLSVAFSADGQLLLSTSYDKTARIWELPSGQLKQTLARHHRPVWDAAFSPDQRTIVTASEDGTAIVWRDETGSWPRGAEANGIVPKFAAHDGPLYAVAFAPGGDLVATAGHDKHIRLWNPDDVKQFSFEAALAEDSRPGSASGEVDHLELVGHSAGVRSLAFSAEGDLLLSGSLDNTSIVWDVAAGQPLKRLRGHSDGVASARFAPGADTDTIVSGSYDGTAKLWSIAGYREQKVLLAQVLRGHDDAVLAASFDPAGERVVTASRDRTARIWQLGDQPGEASSPLVLNEGHEYLVSTTLFTPDGSKLITSAMDNTTRIWDLRTGIELRTLQGTGRRAVADISADGAWLLAAGDDNAGRVIDLANIMQGETMADAAQVVAAEPRAVAITAAVFTDPHGQSCVLADESGRCIGYRRGADGQFAEAWNVAAHSKPVTHLACLPAEGRLLTSSHDGTIRCLDLASGQEIEQLRLQHPDSVAEFALLGESGQLVSACADGRLRICDARRGTIIRELEPVLGGASSLAANLRRQLSRTGLSEEELAMRSQLDPNVIRSILSGNAKLAGGPADEMVEKLAAALGTPPEQLLVSLLNGVDFDPETGLAVTASSVERSVQFWDLSTGMPLAAGSGQSRIHLDPEAIQGQVAAARFVPGRREIVVSGGRRSTAWDLETGQQQMVFSPHGAVAASQFSPHGEFVVTGSWDGTAKLWNAADGASVIRLSGGHAGPINSAAFSPDAEHVLTASDDGTARLWNWKTGELLAEPVLRHAGPIRSAVYSSDGRYVATVCDDGEVGIWPSGSSEPLHRLKGHRAAVLCAAFSADGEYLLTGSRDQTARMWHVASGVQVSVATGHTGEVNSVAFSPDGRRAITGSSDHTAKLWDAQPPAALAASENYMQEVLTLDGHSDAVTSVMFSPGGESILTAGREGLVIVWQAAPVPSSLYLDELDLVLSADASATPLAASAVFSAPMRSNLAGAVLSVSWLENSSGLGRVTLGPPPAGEPGVVVRGETLLYRRSADESIPIGVYAAASGAGPLRLTFNGDARHSMIQQAIRQVQVSPVASNAAAGVATVEFTMELAPGEPPLRARRTVRAQDTQTKKIASVGALNH